MINQELFSRTLRVLLTLSLMSLLAGCSWLGLDTYFRDRSDDYRKSTEIEKTKVPEDLSSEALGELYPVPQGGEVVSYEIDSEFEVPRPRSVAVNESINEVKIQRLGEDIWILMSVPPAEAWPRIRSYLTRNGIPSARADASTGVVETGLFQLSDSETLYHQFHVQLIQGVQLNTTEIEILHRQYNAEQIPENLPAWASTSDDAEREEWLRTGLANSLASDNVAGTASLLGKEIGAAAKVELITPEAELPFIEMRMAFERAWASVGYALGKDGFEIVERQLQSSYYLADYQEPGKGGKSTFLRRLVRLGASNKNEVLSYRVDVTRAGENVEVRVARPDGSLMDQRETYLVLESIRNKLT